MLAERQASNSVQGKEQNQKDPDWPHGNLWCWVTGSFCDVLQGGKRSIRSQRLISAKSLHAWFEFLNESKRAGVKKQNKKPPNRNM